MSYRGAAPSTDQICFPQDALLRLQPRAAGPLVRELVTLSGRTQTWPISPARGLLVVDPRFDRLPLGPGWENRLV